MTTYTAQQPLDLTNNSVLDRVLQACGVDLSNEHRKQLRRFAYEYREVLDGHLLTFAEFVKLSRPRLVLSDG